MRMTVQRRMFLGLLSVIIVFVVAINFVVLNFLGDVAEQEIIIELESAVIAYRRFDTQRQELLTTQALAISQTSHLIATLSIPGVDTETVRVAGQFLDGVAEIDLLLIADDAGTVLANVNSSDGDAELATPLPGLRQVLQGAIATGLWKNEGELFQIVAVPVAANNRLVGLVITGERVDDPDAIQIAQDISGVDVDWATIDEESLVHRDSRRSDTSADFAPLNGGDLVKTIEGVPLQRLNVNHELTFRATMSYPDVESAMIFHRELDLAASGVGRLRLVVLIFSAFIILLSMVLCHRIASRISRPIARLTKATTDFGDGKLDVRLKPESSDEIGVLTEAFNSMAGDIVRNRQQLIDSLDAAQAANHAKSEFLARMSHEIRTPMNGVLGMAEILLLSGVSAQQREYTQAILDSSDGLLAIINDILDFSKIEAGRLELGKSCIDVYETISGAAELLSHHAESKGLELMPPDIPDDPLWVFGDRLRIRQVLTNLIGNAVKFTTHGQIAIQIEEIEKNADGLTLRVEVADTGIGIAPHDLEHVFESFTQVDGSGTRKFGGTGLGLSIGKQLVELMGGEMGVESTLGVGSTFWFELPLERADPNDATLPVSIAGQKQTERTGGVHDLVLNTNVQSITTPLNILLVEDNPANQKVAITMLRLLGCTIDLAEDGEEGLAKVKENSYDIILMDCQMPNMDGFAATARIREWENDQNVASITPIIAVTANALVTDRDRCLAAGMDDYVSKPFTLAELKKNIDRWTPDEHALNSLRPQSDALPIGIAEIDELRDLGASNQEIEEIVDCYIESSTSCIDKMHAALCSRDRDSLRKLAHKLKGGSGQLGAHKVANICGEIIADAQSGDWEPLEVLVIGLTQEINAANEELNILVSRRSA